MPSFFQTVTDAINDIAEYGYESEERLEYWVEEIRRTAQQNMVSEAALTEQLQRVLGATYQRLIDDGSVLQRHPGVDRFSLQRIAPHLRAELDRRILASANLIRLNREQAIAETLRRFQGWATSVPIGGTEQVDRRAEKANVRKSLTSLPFAERRVIIDQGHKLNAALSEIVAVDGGALGAVWRSHWRQAGYDYREDHKERDGVFYAMRDGWAVKRRFVRIGPQGAWEDHEKPGEFVFCRCVAPSTRIHYAQGIRTITRRHYDGPVLQVITSALPKRPLVVTPNHPILSRIGWVAAQSLNVGDDLVELCQENIPSRMGIDHEDELPLVSEIFDAANEAWGSRTIRDSRMQFHGDGIPDGHVDIVRPARELCVCGKAPAHKATSERLFAGTDWLRLGECSMGEVLEGLRSTLNSFGACLAHGFSFLESFGSAQLIPSSLLAQALIGFHLDPAVLGSLGGLQSRRGAGGPNFYTAFSQTSPDRGVRDLKLLCESHGIPTSKIRTAKVLSIKRERFSGHVYNLQTAGEWYAAERIISHNCYAAYKYNLRDVPDEILTERGRAALAAARERMTA